MSISRESLEEALKEDERKRSVSRIEEVCINTGVVAAGENYTSQIFRAELRIVLASGKKKTISVILKELQLHGGSSEFLKTHKMYDTELKLHKEILPLIEVILEEQNIPRLWPKFLGQKEKFLIFEDLKNKNYRVENRHKKLSLEHATLTLRTLALFHSASLVLKHRGLLDVSAIPSSFYFRDTPQIRRYNEQGLRNAAEVILQEWGPEWKDIGKRILKKASVIHDDILKLTTVDESRLNVLCHGDTWTANMMFKYSKGVDYPIGLKLLDFQMPHYNSYIVDLIYFIKTSVPLELRTTSRRLLLECYAKTLGACLESYSLGHLSPSMEEVEAAWNEFDLVNLIFSFTVAPIVASTAQNAFTFEGLYEGKGQPFNPEIYRGTFQAEVSEDLIRWAEKGLF